MMDAVKFLEELHRMCDVKKGICVGCGIKELWETYHLSRTMQCLEILFEHPEEGVAIVEKWSAEHPIKTRLMDFLEKYPSAALRQDGLPPFMPEWLGYCGKSCYSCERQPTEEECWNLPLEE